MCLEVSKYRIGWSGIRDAKTGKRDRRSGLSLAEMAGAKVCGGGAPCVALNQENSLIRAGDVSTQEEQVCFPREAELLK